MEKELKQEKITLPKELQIQMMKFFMKTSIPRIKKMKMEAEKAQAKEEKMSTNIAKCE